MKRLVSGGRGTRLCSAISAPVDSPQVLPLYAIDGEIATLERAPVEAKGGDQRQSRIAVQGPYWSDKPYWLFVSLLEILQPMLKYES